VSFEEAATVLGIGYLGLAMILIIPLKSKGA
jgi:hypothetical protein